MNRWHKFQVRTVLRYEVQTEGWVILNIAAARCGGQRLLLESLSNNHGLDFTEKDAPDGSTRFHGTKAPVGELTIRYEATLERTNEVFSGAWAPWEASLVELPSAVAPYLYPSRYCESDKLVRFAAKEFGDLSLGHSRVAAICNWIYEHIDYLPGATDEHSSAVDCLTSRAGVCRDFAHLGIAFCRALGIPARYVSVYAFELGSSGSSSIAPMQ